MMKRLVSLALMTVMVAGMFGVAMADNHDEIPNQRQFKGSWYYPWIGPGTEEYGTPSLGYNWAETAEGEVVYIDDSRGTSRMIIEADGSGDMMTYYLYDETRYTPSMEGVRVGSHVKVKSDDVGRAREVWVVPFHVWLAQQNK